MLAESLMFSIYEQNVQEILSTGQQELSGKITWLATKIRTGVVPCKYCLKQSHYSGKFVFFYRKLHLQ